MTYQFDVEVAKQHGVDAAIMLHNMAFWLAKNKANRKHEHEGRYWTYNSARAFEELFPFWTAKQIRRILTKLEDDGVIASGSFSDNPYDRTKWYTILDESIFQNGQVEVPKRSNVHVPKRSNVSFNTDIKPDSKHESADAVIDYLNKKAGKHYRHTATNRRLVNARLKEEFTVDDCRTVIDNQVADWRDDQKMNEYLRPSTLFAPTKFEGYLNRKAPGTATRQKLCPKCSAAMIGELCMSCGYEEPVVW